MRKNCLETTRVSVFVRATSRSQSQAPKWIYLVISAEVKAAASASTPILGCGMVDPNVLEACNIDSKVYSGYAFGLGVERITNLKYQVADLRMFSENDVRFLNEFESAN